MLETIRCTRGLLQNIYRESVAILNAFKISSTERTPAVCSDVIVRQLELVWMEQEV